MHAASVAAAFPERILGVALFTPVLIFLLVKISNRRLLITYSAQTSPAEHDEAIGAQLAFETTAIKWLMSKPCVCLVCSRVV